MLRSEDAAKTNDMIKEIYPEIEAVGMVEYFGDNRPEWLEEKE
jgi:hypothetical protein